MSALADLFRAVQAGTAGSADVLHDLLVSEGFPSAAVRSFVHDALLGLSDERSKHTQSAKAYATLQPWTFYYQTELDQNTISTRLFNTLLPPTLTNFDIPQRLLPETSFKLSRVSALAGGRAVQLDV